MGVLSFHATKNVTCGEGGALVLPTNDLAERAEIIREKGTNRTHFLRGVADKYTWVDVGSSYLPSEILAAFLYGQLEACEQVQSQRHARWNAYATQLRAWASRNDVRLPCIPEYAGHAAHLFYLLLPSLEARQSLTAHLAAKQITAAFHYVPLHSSPMGRRYGYRLGDLPVTESVSDRLLRLPLHHRLTESEQARIVDAILAWAP
jgi:dTDP-4-amino-4,6-dideoxygalactose transaminase